MPSVRVAVFPAAGLGTRFLPATKAQPKEMLPLVDRPLVQYVVEEARAAGLERIVIVTGRGKNAIEDHFDTSFELERMLEERQDRPARRSARDLRSRPDLLRPPEVRARARARRPPGQGPRRQRALRGHARRRHRRRGGALHRPDDAGLRAAGKPRHRAPGGPPRADPPLRDRRGTPGPGGPARRRHHGHGGKAAPAGRPVQPRDHRPLPASPGDLRDPRGHGVRCRAARSS